MSSLLATWRNRSTHRQVWALALPMILSNLTIPMVALVDSAVVGHLPHPHQLGAVAVGASFYTIVASVTSFLRMGTTGFTAQATGRGDASILRRILVQGLLLAWVLALTIGLLAQPLADFALGVMAPSAELHDLTQTFFSLRLLGLPATLTQYTLVGWFLGRQNARAPLGIMLVTNIGNVVLALWFVLGLKWGVAGAALAAVCAEWLGVLWGFLLLRAELRSLPARVDWHALRRLQTWTPLLQTNRDIFIRSLALQGVFLSITLRGGHLGDDVVAANALMLNGLFVCSYALDGLAHAVEALSGRAIGARQPRQLRNTLVVAGGWSLLASLAFALFFLFAGDLFIAMQSDMPTVRETARPYLPYLALLPLIAVWSYLLDGLFIGATRAREMRDTMVASVLLTLPVAWFVRDLGNHGLWLALLLFMLLRAALLGAVAFRLHRRSRWIPPAQHG